jgi:hypothetical protein
MNAVSAEPAKAWTTEVIKAITDKVTQRLRQHHPRFQGTAVSVELANGRCFLIEMKGKEGTFDEEGRSILRKFFTEDFKSDVKPLLEDYLGWSCDPRVCTNSRDRRTDCHTWQVGCRDAIIHEVPPVRRKKRRQFGSPAQIVEPFRVR